MDEEMKEVPKKTRRSSKREQRDQSIESNDDMEVVSPIVFEKVESLMVTDKHFVETNNIPMGKEVGLIISDDKMSHRKMAMQCNSCFVADSCPQFKEDSDCTIEWNRLFSGEFRPSDLLQSSVSVLDLQLMRISRASHMEALNQGILDPELSREIGRYFEMMKMFKEMADSPSPTISITARGDAAKSGGVLSQLLFGLDKK